ncbi:uncharacterized protein LOC105164007 [Sesamum indicum]|uniref:Uncharacterized protein LOC105164007 n=1 Tax=Sesamum indicum TaxID=4182 RepID=A0A6I9TDK3_SESIN|nr:uncharacterized protein LOC105164007 [Sesamum indicum]
MEKEERRRKIIARGTDRLALITGRIQTLDPEPITKCSSFTASRQDRYPPAQHARSSSEPVAANDEELFRYVDRNGEDDAFDTVMRHGNRQDVAKGNDSESRASNLLKLEQKEVATLSSDNVNLHEKLFSFYLGSITLKEINFGIISSEDTRVMCSMAIAILVVLSNVTLPHDVAKPKSLIAYRPIFVVLLTDMFILAAKLAPYAQIRKEDKEPQVEENGGVENWGGAVQLLEIGVVLHQTVRALFIDFSFYLVVVVCGLSLI